VKRLAIKVAGSEREPIDVKLEPGTTCNEILTDLRLQGYLLSLPNSNRFFGNEEVLYGQVVDGDKLFATTPADVGSN
jgi:hypothetical protein